MTEEVSRRFILHAPNVYCGGGLSLLTALIEELPEKSILILDARLAITDKALDKFEVYKVKPTLWHRFMGERLLKQLASDQHRVLCFANLPPLFKLKSHVTVFMQNRYLVESSLDRSISFKLYLRLSIERVWFFYLNKNADHIFVQSNSMKLLTDKITNKPATVAPFAPQMKPFVEIKEEPISKKYDFIYVAFGEPHKNHKNLLLAWVELAKKNYFPSLCLTVCNKSYPLLAEEIKNISLKYQLNIANVGVVPIDKIYQLYQQSEALIFPSIMESFGLPLLEAKKLGLTIIASELDYVRDLINPDESFDPHSPLSIARAVMRSEKIFDKKQELISAKFFLKAIKLKSEKGFKGEVCV